MRVADPHPVNAFARFLAIPESLHRAGVALIPYAVVAALGGTASFLTLPPQPALWAALGAVALLCALALAAAADRQRLPLAALALLAPCWTILVPSNNALFEALFAVGTSLALFALTLARINSAKLTQLAGLAAVPAFALSSLLMAELGSDPVRRGKERAMADDFAFIRELATGKTILFEKPQGGYSYYRQLYYLADSIFTTPGARRFADFIVSERISGAPSLTPNNRRLFLYAYDQLYDRIDPDAVMKALRQPPIAASSGYAIHFGDAPAGARGTKFLLYSRADCAAAAFAPRFFLHVHPVAVEDLPAQRRRHGFDNLDFNAWQVAREGGHCYAMRHLPDYPIARIGAGQFAKRETAQGARFENIWAVDFAPPLVPRPAPAAATGQAESAR